MQSEELRRQAEELLTKKNGNASETASSDALELLHELQVHQVELEMQNEELQQAQRELCESRDRYFELYNLAPVAYFTLDEHCVIKGVNLTGVQLLGVNKQRLLNRRFASFVEPDSRERFYSSMRKAAALAASQACELVMRSKDGATFYAQVCIGSVAGADRRPVQYRLTVMDIAERKRTEQAQQRLLEHVEGLSRVLSREMNTLRTIMDNTHAMLAYLDPEFNFVKVNSAYAASCGYTREELVGQNHFALFPSEENRAIFERVRETRDPARFHDKPFIYPNQPQRGVTYWDWTLTPVDGVSGDLQGLILSLVETTGRVLGEQALKQARDELEAKVAGRTTELVALNRGLNEEVKLRQRAEDELRSLSQRLVDIQETERRALARELHDQVGQPLALLNITLESAARCSGDRNAIISEAQELVGGVMTWVHDLSLDLRPAMLDDLGLLPTLRWYLGRYGRRTGIQVKFRAVGLGRHIIPLQISTAAYRIVQETLANVARHAGVKEATLRLRANSRTLSVQVEDKGAGFDPAKLSAEKSTGLNSMRERVHMLDGRLTIQSAPGSGTTIIADLPLPGQPGKRQRPRRAPEAPPAHLS